MDDPWAEILVTQDGVVRAEQALRHLGESTVRWRLRTGRWQRIHPRVIVTHGGPPSRDQLRWAAVLHVGRSAVLSRGTAAEIGGLDGFAAVEIHVTATLG